MDKGWRNSEKTAMGDLRKGDLLGSVGKFDSPDRGDVNNTLYTGNKLNLPQDIFSKKIESANRFLLAVYTKYKYREMSCKERITHFPSRV